MNNKNLELRYGVLCDSLEKQLEEQGYMLDKDELERAEEIRNAINMCMFHVATDSQVNKMFSKLHKIILKDLKIIKK